MWYVSFCRLYEAYLPIWFFAPHDFTCVAFMFILIAKKKRTLLTVFSTFYSTSSFFLFLKKWKERKMALQNVYFVDSIWNKYQTKWYQKHHNGSSLCVCDDTYGLRVGYICSSAPRQLKWQTINLFSMHSTSFIHTLIIQMVREMGWFRCQTRKADYDRKKASNNTWNKKDSYKFRR